MKATQEHAKYFLPFVQALAEGKRVETTTDKSDWSALETYPHGEDWFTKEDYRDYVIGTRRFRIVEPPKLRPWTEADVPPDAIIREQGYTDGWSRIVGVRGGAGCFSGVWVLGPSGATIIPFEKCLAIKEHSTDGGVTWKPCGVQE